MQKLIIVLLILILPILAFAEIRDDDINGHEWQQWDRDLKIGFAVGFLTAANYVAENNITFVPKDYAISETSKKIDAGEKISDKEWMYYWKVLDRERLSRHTVYNISAAQIADGLDSFYADFKNRNIEAPDAVYIVKMQIGGASEEKIEAISQYLRSGKKLEKLSYKNSNGDTVFIIFP